MHIGSCNGVVRQLDRHTGRERWSATARQGAGKYFFHGDLLITDDLVIAGADIDEKAGGGSVHAFDRSTGRQRWTRPAGRGVAAALVGQGDAAFAQTLNGELWALAVASGERRWSFALKPWAWEGPVTGADRVFAPAADGTVHALDATTGRVAWQVALGAPVTTSITRLDTTLYAGTADGVLHRIDARDGRVLSTQRLDATLQPRNRPVVVGDAIVVLLADRGEDNRALVALDPTLKTVRWRVAAPDKWSTTRVYASSHSVVMGTSAGEVIAYRATDGARAWSHTLKGTVRAIGGADDVLYVGSVEGTLYALRVP